MGKATVRLHLVSLKIFHSEGYGLLTSKSEDRSLIWNETPWSSHFFSLSLRHSMTFNISAWREINISTPFFAELVTEVYSYCNSFVLSFEGILTSKYKRLEFV